MLAVVIVAGAAALRLFFFSGIVFYDDVHYTVRALALSQGHLDPPAGIFDTRIGLVGPTALLYRAFGVSKFTTGGFAFLCSLLGVGAAFFFGSKLFGARVGLLAAALLAVFPMDVLYAGVQFATTPMTLCVGASLGFFLLGEQRPRPALYLASGLSLGAGAVIHETALLSLVFYPVYAVCVSPPTRRHALVAAGLALALAVDPLVHGLLGDPWARLSILRQSSVLQGQSVDSAFRGLNTQWMTEPFARMLSEQELGLYPWLVAPVALLRLRSSNRNERALALFIAVVSLWLLFGTVSPLRYAPLSRQPRYLAPVVMAAVLLIAHELSERRGSRTRATVTAVLVATAILCVAADGGRARLRPYEEVRTVLAQAGADHVVVERDHRFPLLFTEGFKPRYGVDTLDPQVDPPAGTVVVVASGAGRPSVASLPGAERIARVTQPDTMYKTLLGWPPVQVVLRLTRPGYRVRDLEVKNQPWALEVYRTPRE